MGGAHRTNGREELESARQTTARGTCPRRTGIVAQAKTQKTREKQRPLIPVYGGSDLGIVREERLRGEEWHHAYRRSNPVASDARISSQHCFLVNVFPNYSVKIILTINIFLTIKYFVPETAADVPRSDVSRRRDARPHVLRFVRLVAHSTPLVLCLASGCCVLSAHEASSLPRDFPWSCRAAPKVVANPRPIGRFAHSKAVELPGRPESREEALEMLSTALKERISQVRAGAPAFPGSSF